MEHLPWSLYVAIEGHRGETPSCFWLLHCNQDLKPRPLALALHSVSVSGDQLSGATKQKPPGVAWGGMNGGNFFTALFLFVNLADIPPFLPRGISIARIRLN